MQIICEFCGHVIDTDIDDCCNNCGASFKDHKAFIEQQKINMEQEHFETTNNQSEKTEAQKRQQEQQKAVLKKVLLIYIIIMVVLPTVISLITGIIELVAFLLSAQSMAAIQPILTTGRFVDIVHWL